MDAKKKSQPTKAAKKKVTLYLAEDVLDSILEEANRLDRSPSWIVQQSWKTAREELRRLPGIENYDANRAHALREELREELREAS